MIYQPAFDYTPYLPTKVGQTFEGFRGLWHEREVCENLLQLHRFRYYVIGEALITDGAYDRLERRLRRLYRFARLRPPKASVLNTVGSSLIETYPYHIRRFFAKTYGIQ